MISVLVGERKLPLIWAVESSVAGIGFETQRALLKFVDGCLPDSATVPLAAVRTFIVLRIIYYW
jgi:hypothetical protein